MSHRLISLSPDLKKLRDEGYDISTSHGYLLMRDVPYVTSSREVKRGTLVAPLTLAGDITTTPADHTVMFAGEVPCDSKGGPLSKVLHSSSHQRLADGLVVDHTFSSKPQGGYADFYKKMSTYAAILTSPAQAIDPSITPRTFPVVESDEESSVFHYVDTASSRAGIGAITAKLETMRIGIVGLGGTGSYILDLVGKTPVNEIHLFDGDLFLQHNAFRSPGAPSTEMLRQQPTKSEYWASVYSNLRTSVIPHPYRVDETTVEELLTLDFVFIATEGGADKATTLRRLEEGGVPFIDVGVGVYEVNGSLAGTVRITTATPTKHDHIWKRISVTEAGENDYDHNIQVADLNCLNAALAVIRWKRLFGFYNDLEHEHQSTYDIDGNHLTNEDRA